MPEGAFRKAKQNRYSILLKGNSCLNSIVWVTDPALPWQTTGFDRLLFWCPTSLRGHGILWHQGSHACSVCLHLGGENKSWNTQGIAQASSYILLGYVRMIFHAPPIFFHPQKQQKRSFKVVWSRDTNTDDCKNSCASPVVLIAQLNSTELSK